MIGWLLNNPGEGGVRYPYLHQEKQPERGVESGLWVLVVYHSVHVHMYLYS